MKRFKLTRVGAVAVASLLGAGAGAAVLGSASAAPSAHHQGARAAQAGGGPAGRRLLRRAVHLDAVVAAKGGKFAAVSFDRGIVQSVSGSQLTLREGDRQATYKTITLTVPPNAIVHNDRMPAQLSSVKPGQRAFVLVGPKHTRVGAFTVK